MLMGCGKDGTNGKDGAAGISISYTRYCSYISSGLLFVYQFTKYSTGDAFVSCEVSDNIGSFSSSKVYMASQAGATSGGCSVTDDIDSPYTGGFWSFQIASSTASVTYNDSGSSNNNLKHTFSFTECTDYTP